MDHTPPNTNDDVQSVAHVKISDFRNERDKTPKPRELAIDALFAEMTDHRTAVDKKGGRLWSPIVFDGPRKGANAVEVSLLVFDIDDGTSPIEIIDWLHGLHAAVASTFKSTEQAWRLRVMVELAEPIPAAEYRQVWDDAVEFLLHGHVDGGTYDLARMFYLPTHQPGVTPFAQILSGTALDWRALPVADVAPPKRFIKGLEDIAGLDAGDERRRAVGLLRSFADAIAQTPPGERHATILAKARAAGGLRAYLDYDEITAALLDAAERCGEVEQYGEDAVRRTIDDGISYGVDEPWTPAQLGEAPKAKLTRHQDDAATDESESVVLYDPPEFPERVLPPSLLALCKESSLPTALLAGAGLATLAIAVGGDAEVVVNRSHVERAILFVPLVGPKSVGKSPSMEMATRPLVTRNDLVWERYLLELQEWQALEPKERKQHPRPVDPRIYGGDATSPALLRHMAVRRDMGRVLHEMRQTLFYDRDHQAHLDTGLLLQLWSGNSAGYTRVGTGRGGGNDVDLYVARPTCSILGDLQPKFHGLLGQDDDGMRPRWLPHVWFERFIGERRYPSDAAVLAWDDVIHKLLKRREGFERVGMHLTRQWTLADAARRYLDERVLDWMTRSDTAENTSYQAGLTKAETNVLRTSLVLAEAEAMDLRQTIVTRDILERAAEWVEYSLKCWMVLGEYDILSITQQQKALDPAVRKLREYIETQGDTDPQTGRRYVLASRILNNGVAGATNKFKRDTLVAAYGIEYPGCVEDKSSGPQGGRRETRVWAPIRRGWHPDQPPQHPDQHPDQPPPDPDQPAPDPDQPAVDQGSDRLIRVENSEFRVDQGAEENADASRAGARESPGDNGDQGDQVTQQGDQGDIGDSRARASRAHTRPSASRPLVEKTLASARACAYALTKTQADFEVALETLTRQATVGMDSETTTLHAQQGGRMRLLQLASGEKVYVCDLDAIGDWRTPLRQFLRGRDGPRLVLQEAVFDLGWLHAAGLTLPHWSRLFDTRLAARLTESRGQPGFKYDLRTLAKRLLDVDLPKELQTSDWSAPTLSVEQLQYAANDAGILLELHAKLVPELDKLEAWDVFRLEHRLLPSMVWLRENGAPVDVPMLQSRAAEALALRDERLTALHQLAGTVQELRPPNGLRKKDPPRAANEMNWSSTPQLRERLALESTRKQYLLQLDPMPPIVEALLAWRGATRLAAYGDQLLTNALIGDRVYGSFDSLGAATGRMSCRAPNLQQMHRGKHYRETIAAPAGRTLVKVDYNALQMRIAADISGDQALIALFNAGGDPHTLTAQEVLGNVEGRQAAKSINFGLLFGSSAATLRTTALTGYGVRMTLEQAAEYRAAFFGLYPGLLAWHNRFEHKRNAPLNVSDPSLSGRVRRSIQGFNERINTPVQMVEVHGMKRAMIMLHSRRAEQPDAKLVLAVHDELVLECAIEDAYGVATWLEGIMLTAMQPLLEHVPVVVESTIYPRWWKPKSDTLGDLLPIGEEDDNDVSE